MYQTLCKTYDKKKHKQTRRIKRRKKQRNQRHKKHSEKSPWDMFVKATI